MVPPLAGPEELSYETDLRQGRGNVWKKLCEGGGKSRGSKGGQNHRTSPRRSRSTAPLGAIQPPTSVRHAAISAQNRRHRASRPPGHPCEHKKTTSGKWRKAQRQSATSELHDSENDTKHADAVSRGQNREQDAKMRREVAPKWSQACRGEKPQPAPPKS